MATKKHKSKAKAKSRQCATAAAQPTESNHDDAKELEPVSESLTGKLETVTILEQPEPDAAAISSSSAGELQSEIGNGAESLSGFVFSASSESSGDGGSPSDSSRAKGKERRGQKQRVHMASSRGGSGKPSLDATISSILSTLHQISSSESNRKAGPGRREVLRLP